MNDAFLMESRLQSSFDPATDTVTFGTGAARMSYQLVRADPSVPITRRVLAEGGAYRAGKRPNVAAARAEREREYEGKLENYYDNAHQVCLLVQGLPGLHRFKCIQVRDVRNKLVNHHEAGEIYSFGFGSSGPTVRPMRSRARKWEDAGLVPNAEAFVRALTDAFERELLKLC